MKPKPYYSKRGFRLFRGDCVQALRERFRPSSVDMVFADPPYNLSNGGYTVHSGRRVSVNKAKWDKSDGLDEDFAFHCAWIDAVWRVLKPQGTLWISGTYHSIYQCGFALQKAGFHILNDIAWFKPNASPNLGCRCFTASHETLLWASKGKGEKHFFNYKLMKNGEWPEDGLKVGKKQMRTVWSITTAKKDEKRFGKHPTQKPVALLERIIQASTQEKDLVVDPFSGSATTGIAAYALKRKYAGIDTEKKYLDLAIKRFEGMKKGGKG